MAKKLPADQPAAPGVVVDISELKSDPDNRRKRTDRGRAMLRESFEDVGAGRSVLVDEDNQLIAGSGSVEGAAAAGITKARIIETDGNELIVVKRRNLTPEQRRRMAMYDNRTGELAEWDVDQLREDQAAGVDLAQFFEQDELDELLDDDVAGGERQAVVQEVDTTPVADKFWIAIRGPLEQQAYALRRLRDLMSGLPGVEVELGTIAAQPDEE